jgi:PAS domain S-box-containing protein
LDKLIYIFVVVHEVCKRDFIFVFECRGYQMVVMGDETVGAKKYIGSWWYKYRSFVGRSILGSDSNEPEHIIVWRDHIFARLIIYLLPICFIALIPGVYIGLKTGYIFVAVFDASVVSSVALVSLSKKCTLLFKKVFIIVILYALSIVLMLNLGFMGPGFVYLLALSIITTLIFPPVMAYGSVALNIVICSCFAIIVDRKLFDIMLVHEYNTGSYIAVSSNLIFLSWLSVLLISNTLAGLEGTITKSALLKEKLKKENAKRMQSTQKLKESNEYYQSLFTLNPSPMWVLDNETGKFLQVNEAAIKNYGYTNKEFLSMTINDIKLEKDMVALYADVKKNTEMGIPIRLTTQHRRKNGELFPVDVIFDTITYGGRQARLVTALDITEQMIYTTALEHQNNKLREIAHIQSHIVRAPLATIMGLTHIFKEKITDVRTEEIIDGIIVSSEKLDNVIREIVNKTSAIDIA